jgi:hypothetical protein
MTPVPSRSQGDAATFVVCLDCGKRFSYDWERMRRGSALKAAEGERGGAVHTP